jgi:glycosyltransferase involved in cell wall biosynthesis
MSENPRINRNINFEVSNLHRDSRNVDVCLLAENYYPVLTGAGERFRRYAPGLRNRGIDLRVVTVNSNCRPSSEIIEGTSIQRFSMPNTLDLFAGSGSASALLLRNAINHFSKNKDWPDVLHILTHTLDSVVDLGQVRLSGIPCINSVTMMPLEGSTPIGKVKTFIYYWLKYLPFNLIVANSQTMAQRMIQLGVTPNRIETIPNGVDLLRFHPAHSLEEKIAIRQRLGLKADAEIILFVGYIIPRKGIDLLLGAWSEIARARPMAHLVLVGPYENESQKEIDRQTFPTFFTQMKNIVQESAAPVRVAFTGEVTNVDDYLRAADIFVFPSRQEGSPNALFEAMATGLPCVTTPFKGLSPELGTAGKDFLLASFTTGSIAENTIRILSTQGLGRRIGQSARHFAEKHFDIEHSLDQYANMYQKLAGSRKNRSGILFFRKADSGISYE